MEFKINNGQTFSMTQVKPDGRVNVKERDHTGAIKYGHTIENHEMVMLVNAFLNFKEGDDVNLKDYLKEV